ncbi:MAG: DUF5667 domain-containing protein [Candidatus Roizmanbacteria bacterium]|nr:DUF5667 domain-containing protein [Candidatus Roizmanbacteria bacterium]
MPTVLSEKEEELIQSVLHRFKILPLIVIVLLLFFSILFVRDLAQQSVFGTISQKLPFPGILPDNKLYPLKAFRDKLLVYTTRDAMKKAQLLQHLSDKRIASAGMMDNCDKATSVALRAEEELGDVKRSLEKGSSMGSEPEVGYIMKSKQALAEHRVVLTNIKKRCGNNDSLRRAMTENKTYEDWFLREHSIQQ